MTCAIESSGSVNITEIGWIWVSTTIPVVSLACTMLPGSTRRMPVVPANGAVMVAYSSCVRALSMAARVHLYLRLQLLPPAPAAYPVPAD